MDEQPVNAPSCYACQKPVPAMANFQCGKSKCFTAIYCGRDCQVQHWSTTHKRECKVTMATAWRDICEAPDFTDRMAEGDMSPTELRKIYTLAWSLRGTCGGRHPCECHDWWHLRAVQLLGVREANNGTAEGKAKYAELARRALTTIPWPPIREWDPVMRPRLLCMGSLCFLGHAHEVITLTQPHLSGLLDGSVQLKDREEQIWVLCQMTEWLSCAAAQAKDEGEKHEYLRRAHALADVTLSTHRRYAPKPKDVGRRSASLDAMASEAKLAGVHHLAIEFARASVEILPVQSKAWGVLELVGEHLFNVGRLSEAREILDHAIATYEMGPDVLARALLAKSLLALDAGEPTKALDHAVQVSKLFLHSSELRDRESGNQCECCKPANQIRFVMAEALEQLEGLSQALDFEEAFAWQHEGPALLTRRALAQLEEGNREEAKMHLRRAIAPDCKAPQGFFRAFGYMYRIQRRPMEILLRLLLEEGPESDTEAASVQGMLKNVGGEEAERSLLLEETRALMANRRAAEQQQPKKPASRQEQGSKQQAQKGDKKKPKQKQRMKGGGKQKGKERPVGGGAAAMDMRADQGPLSSEGEKEAHEEARPHAIDEEERDRECPVCMEECPDEAVVMGCGHQFCEPCIDQWFGKCNSKSIEVTCPMCRVPLSR